MYYGTKRHICLLSLLARYFNTCGCVQITDNVGGVTILVKEVGTVSFFEILSALYCNSNKCR